MSSHVRPKPDEAAEAHRQRIIKRFCELQSLVANHVHEYRYAADCFCRQGWHPEPVTSNWRNDEAALDFIEMAVIDAVAKTNDVDTRVPLYELSQIRRNT